MGRLARFKVEGGGGYYHVYAKVACRKGEYPLNDAVVRRKLMDTVRNYATAYCCEVASVCVMGNHWHAVIKFNAFRELGDEELVRRAKLLYPSNRSLKLLRDWTPEKWDKLNKRLFDISELMRNIQMYFARWYNRKFERQGKLWADRFKSTYLTNIEAVRDCMLYIELNPVRAGIVEKPEEYQGSSLYLRDMGKDSWLSSLTDMFGVGDEKINLKEYKAMIYYRGEIKTKERQARIPRDVVEAEVKRGFKSRGVFRKRIRYFAEGIILGSSEEIKRHLNALKKNKKYYRRRNPIPQGEGNSTFTLRGAKEHGDVLWGEGMREIH